MNMHASLLKRDFESLNRGVRILEADLTAMVLDHRSCFPEVRVRMGVAGEEADMLQLDDILFFRLHKGGLFHRTGGGNAVAHVAERVNVMDGWLKDHVDNLLLFLGEHECKPVSGTVPPKED